MHLGEGEGRGEERREGRGRGGRGGEGEGKGRGKEHSVKCCVYRRQGTFLNVITQWLFVDGCC